MNEAQSLILLAVFGLIAWTLVVFFWMDIVRIRAMQGKEVDLQPYKNTGIESILPDQATAVGRNYNHLMEQPTIFYAMCFYLVVAGSGTMTDAYLACGYTLLRVVHSFVQNTSNVVMVRFSVFTLSTFLLIAMVVREGMRLL